MRVFVTVVDLGSQSAAADHLDPAPGETAGGFAETVENVALVGTRMVDHIVANWGQWAGGVPRR